MFRWPFCCIHLASGTLACRQGLPVIQDWHLQPASSLDKAHHGPHCEAAAVGGLQLLRPWLCLSWRSHRAASAMSSS